MTIYQTKITKKILERIESVSDVTWNLGANPTMYFIKDDRYLNISDEPYYPDGFLIIQVSMVCHYGLETDIMTEHCAPKMNSSTTAIG